MAGSSSSEALTTKCLQAAKDIYAECIKWEESKTQEDPPAESRAGTERSLAECESGHLGVLASAARNLTETFGHTPLKPTKVLVASRRLDDLISISYGQFHAFKFQDLPHHWRQLYTDASILKFGYLFANSSVLASLRDDTSHPSSECNLDKETGEVDCMVEVLDLALIRAGGAGDQRGKRWVGEALEILEQVWNERRVQAEGYVGRPPAKRAKLRESEPSPSARTENPELVSSPAFPVSQLWTPPVTNPIVRRHGWTLDRFEQYVNSTGNSDGSPPVIFTDLIKDWPALTSNPWSKPDYLLSRTFGGRRLVPVEIGRSYVDSGWGQELLPFKQFLARYIGSSSEGKSPRTGYLAQHELFTQIPSLRRDITVPEFCYADVPPHANPSQNRPQLPNPAENAWFGPAGTITPLHTDSYYNLLCQVVGIKYVRLYAPSQTPRLRPRGVEGGVDMHNTSGIDVGVIEGWDDVPSEGEGSTEDWSDFKEAAFVDCILHPGETLYIPIGWWHYVRSLSVSFSVSFWWN